MFSNTIHCSYKLMHWCWQKESKDRPTFLVIANTMADIAGSIEQTPVSRPMSTLYNICIFFACEKVMGGNRDFTENFIYPYNIGQVVDGFSVKS